MTDQSVNWIFVAWLTRAGRDVLAYGCSAPCSRRAGWRKPVERIDLASGEHLHLVQMTISATETCRLRKEVEQGTLDLRTFIPEISTPWTTVQRGTIIRPALGCSAARATPFCTLPVLSDVAGSDNIDFVQVLKSLERHLGLPFTTEYVSHIGNFELFALEPWGEQPPAVLIEFERGPQSLGPGGDRKTLGPLVIARESSFARNKHIAHLVCRADGDVITDKLITLDTGCERVYPFGTEIVDVDALEFRVFDASGSRLIHQDEATFLSTIDMTISPVGRSLAIEDQLTAAARSGGADGAEGVAIVRTQSSERSRIEMPSRHQAWRKYTAEARARLAESSPSPSNDRWFAKSIDAEVGVIRHFDTLLFGGRVRAAILVDPFFSPDALRRVVLRLSSQDVGLTVVTSWAEIEPDTGRAINDGTASLKRALAHVAPFLNARLRVINLVDGRDQAFHDRYLLLYAHEGPAIVYLLSNSLNKMAGRWPFCMSRLADDVRPAAQRYIEGLANGVDTTGSTSPRITFDWSPPPASRG